MTVIITGAGGLLGHRLAAAARHAGHRVVAIGRAAQPPPGLACDEWLPGDLADPRLLRPDWKRLAGAPVFHLAADTRIYEPGRSFAPDATAVTATVIAIAQRTGGRLVFFSSAAVYSGPRTRRPLQRLSEQDETAPATAYGRAKLATELALGRAGVDAVALRLFGVLSERLATAPDRGNLVQAILRSWRTGCELGLAVDDTGAPAIRDYVHEEDVCRCALAALAWPRGDAGPIIANVCTGEGVSTVEMAAAAGRALGGPWRSRLDPLPGAVSPVMVGDPTTLRSLLGWVPRNRTAEYWAQLRTTLAPGPGSSASGPATPARP